MNPQFERAAAIIVAVCIVVFGAGATLLTFALRSFRTAQRGDIKHIVLLVVAIAFILVACVVLLVWSSLQRG